MKVGILGGSFDPLHNGHLFMAKNAYEQYNLDEIWLIPNGHAPHKYAGKMADPLQRFTMCKMAEESIPYIKACDIEIASDDCSYTYITMQKLTAKYPEHSFYFIMGADSLDYFDKWRNPDIISSLCTILVVNRDEFTVEVLKVKIHRIKQLFPAEIHIVHCGKYDVSSTEIRNGEKLDDVLPEIREYILENHLYGL
jgi:nicotinate-nucleotide adenylyltransferase